MKPTPQHSLDIVGLGIDLVALPRFSTFASRHSDSLAEVFTPSGLAAADRHHSRDLYLATRWACKEAFLKALGTGWGAGTQWTDVEVAGRLLTPCVRLKGVAAQTARKLGACRPIGSVGWAGPNVIALALLARTARHSEGGREHEIPPR
ncbi:MAG: holo-ACP synthase [Armatimonadota bacterium]|nr:MAG: holo-ACP synthase [Armatimonadota bacterium]